MKQADTPACAGSKAEAASLFAAAAGPEPTLLSLAGQAAAICLSVFALAFIARIALFFGAAAQSAAAPIGAVSGLIVSLILAAGALIAAAAVLCLLYQRLGRARAEQAQLQSRLAALQRELNRRPAASAHIAAVPALPAAAALPPAAPAQGLEALLNAAPLPLWLRQADGKLMFVNNAGKALLRAYLTSSRAKAAAAGAPDAPTLMRAPPGSRIWIFCCRRLCAAPAPKPGPEEKISAPALIWC